MLLHTSTIERQPHWKTAVWALILAMLFSLFGTTGGASVVRAEDEPDNGDTIVGFDATIGGDSVEATLVLGGGSAVQNDDGTVTITLTNRDTWNAVRISPENLELYEVLDFEWEGDDEVYGAIKLFTDDNLEEATHAIVWKGDEWQLYEYGEPGGYVPDTSSESLVDTIQSALSHLDEEDITAIAFDVGIGMKVGENDNSYTIESIEITTSLKDGADLTGFNTFVTSGDDFETTLKLAHGNTAVQNSDGSVTITLHDNSGWNAVSVEVDGLALNRLASFAIDCGCDEEEPDPRGVYHAIEIYTEDPDNELGKLTYSIFNRGVNEDNVYYDVWDHTNTKWVFDEDDVTPFDAAMYVWDKTEGNIHRMTIDAGIGMGVGIEGKQYTIDGMIIFPSLNDGHPLPFYPAWIGEDRAENVNLKLGDENIAFSWDVVGDQGVSITLVDPSSWNAVSVEAPKDFSLAQLFDLEYYGDGVYGAVKIYLDDDGNPKLAIIDRGAVKPGFAWGVWEYTSDIDGAWVVNKENVSLSEAIDHVLDVTENGDRISRITFDVGIGMGVGEVGGNYYVEGIHIYTRATEAELPQFRAWIGGERQSNARIKLGNQSYFTGDEGFVRIELGEGDRNGWNAVSVRAPEGLELNQIEQFDWNTGLWIFDEPFMILDLDEDEDVVDDDVYGAIKIHTNESDEPTHAIVWRGDDVDDEWQLYTYGHDDEEVGFVEDTAFETLSETIQATLDHLEAENETIHHFTFDVGIGMGVGTEGRIYDIYDLFVTVSRNDGEELPGFKANVDGSSVVPLLKLDHENGNSAFQHFLGVLIDLQNNEKWNAVSVPAPNSLELRQVIDFEWSSESDESYDGSGEVEFAFFHEEQNEVYGAIKINANDGEGSVDLSITVHDEADRPWILRNTHSGVAIMNDDSKPVTGNLSQVIDYVLANYEDVKLQSFDAGVGMGSGELPLHLIRSIEVSTLSGFNARIGGSKVDAGLKLGTGSTVQRVMNGSTTANITLGDPSEWNAVSVQAPANFQLSRVTNFTYSSSPSDTPGDNAYGAIKVQGDGFSYAIVDRSKNADTNNGWGVWDYSAHDEAGAWVEGAKDLTLRHAISKVTELTSGETIDSITFDVGIGMGVGKEGNLYSVSEINVSLQSTTGSRRDSSGGPEPADNTQDETPLPKEDQQTVKPDEPTFVKVGGNGFTLEVNVPSGVLDDEGTINVTPVAPGDVPTPGAGQVRIGDQVYEITITDNDGNSVRSFDRPLTLTFEYDSDNLPDGVDEEDLQVFYYNEDLGTWILVPSVRQNGTVTATVDHLTVFALLATDLKQPTDLHRHWSEADVLKLISLGAISGYEDGTFRPNQTVTRAEFTKMLVEISGLKPIDAQLNFSDTVPSWASGYVAAAVQAGLITGFSDNTFRANESITREQLAVMVARSLDASSPIAASFTDSDSISTWAQAGVATAVEAGIINGYNDGSFQPQRTASRAEAATMLSRLVDVQTAIKR